MPTSRRPIAAFAFAFAFALLPLLAACGGEEAGTAETAEPAPAAPVAPDPERLAGEILIVDTHIDLPYRIEEDGREDLSAGTSGDFDLVRAREGGLDAAFMSIYVPARFQGTPEAAAVAERLIDLVESIAADHPELAALARSPAEVREVAASGRVALPMGMENGAPIGDDPAQVAYWAERGIRYVTLTHSEDNQLADSSYSDEATWGGLSPLGREVVGEMNRHGVMVDVSHLSDAAIEDVLEVTRAPVIASHSSCRHFTPGWERNLSDELIRRIAAGGGVVQINFGSPFLTDAARRQAEAAWGELRRRLESGELDEHGTDAFWEEYWQEHERIYADLSDVVDHIDHVVELVGVDHVGFGSDFDGVGDSLPTGLKDVSDFPNLIGALLERGYSEEEVAKIAGGNLLRVWEEIERVAAASG